MLELVEKTSPAPFARPSVRKPMELARQEKPRMGRDYHGRSLEGREERLKVKVRDKDEFTLGRETVDLRYVEQLVDREQTESLAQMLKYAREHVIDGRKNVSQWPSRYGRSWRQTVFLLFAADPICPAVWLYPAVRSGMPA